MADFKELADVIYKKHGIKVDKDDPILVMATISEAVVKPEREALQQAIKAMNEQSKAQLSVDQIRALQSLVSRKARPNYLGFALGLLTSFLVTLTLVFTVGIWYEPAKIGKRFLDAFPTMDKATQDTVRKAMSK